MKNVYVILAFHAHELLWDLPEKLLSYLDDNNPMKESLTGENYLKKRKEEERDIYTLCSETGDRLQAPMCVEYSNELLVQIRDVMPEVFERLRKDFRRGRLYPLYGHAHHTHVSLLKPEEIIQEIVWNREYLHNALGAPFPAYNGLFPVEASLSRDKLAGIAEANIDYVIFPHLREDKVPFELQGEGDYVYRPFFIRAPRKDLLALPRNFPISQEIWRPITKMKRDEVKNQGYMLGDFPVFDNEYFGDREEYPISLEEGVEMYKRVLKTELEKAPEGGLLLYVQDLELMDFGDIALEIIERAWKDVINEESERYKIHFITPDRYIDEVLIPAGMDSLPTLKFDKISWAPEIRLILRADGHYPPLGVSGVDGYDIEKTGLFHNPHIFWENGKYYCGIFDVLLKNMGISVNVPVDVKILGEREYNLASESLESQAVLYSRLMKRACNWGWRPTEGRQKRPCLLGYLLCDVLLEKLHKYPHRMALSRQLEGIDGRSIVGLCETLKVFIDNRVNYLQYGMDEYCKEYQVNLNEAYALFEDVYEWKEVALKKAETMFDLLQKNPEDWEGLISLLQEYSRAMYMATDYIQRVWTKVPDAGYLVGKMYHYLYRIYPPLFPRMIEKIDSMSKDEVEEYFKQEIKERELDLTFEYHHLSSP